MSAQDGSRLHPLVAGFVDAEVYDRGRPLCDAHAIAVLREGLGLEDGAPVLELGPGTGQLSRALLAAGLDVTAVEPLAQMRALLVRAIGAERVLEGVAEDIPLPDASVDAVLAADSFHWFDEARTMPEIARVLRPGGGVAILRSAPSMDAPWTEELGTILMDGRPEHPAFGVRGAADALEDDPAFGEVREAAVTSERLIDREGIIAFISSISWVGLLTEARRSQLLDRVAALLEREDVREWRQPVVHQIWMAKLL